MRNLTLISLLVVSASLGVGFLLGSEARPTPVNSMLADAQIVAQDRHVRYVGYLCGDDGAAVISRNVPSECKDIWLLNEQDEFKAPPRT